MASMVTVAAVALHTPDRDRAARVRDPRWDCGHPAAGRSGPAVRVPLGDRQM